MRKLEFYGISMGCDPEFFFATGNKVVESGKVLQKTIKSTTEYTTQETIVRDGVQAEIHPRAYYCRAYTGNDIHRAFMALNNKLKKENEGVKVSFEQVQHLTKEQMTELDEESKKFGCAPSFNSYTGKESSITVDPAVYQYRSAGGHIHLGDDVWIKNFMHNDPKLFVDLLDLICGNTCVLIDRDPGQVERRKVYGRAGEYRLPKHGIEYRVPSNFWLKSYQLMSLALNLARWSAIYALNICVDEHSNAVIGNEYIHRRQGAIAEKSDLRSIFDLYDKKDVEEAINTNDFDLAYKNFNKVKDFLVDLVDNDPYEGSQYPLKKRTLAAFEYFVNKGVDYWFKEDPMDHWLHLPEGHGIGWESFLDQVVTSDMTNGKSNTLTEIYFKDHFAVAKKLPLNDECYDKHEEDYEDNEREEVYE